MIFRVRLSWVLWIWLCSKRWAKPLDDATNSLFISRCAQLQFIKIFHSMATFSLASAVAPNKSIQMVLNCYYVPLFNIMLILQFDKAHLIHTCDLNNSAISLIMDRIWSTLILNVVVLKLARFCDYIKLISSLRQVCWTLSESSQWAVPVVFVEIMCIWFGGKTFSKL